MTSAAAVRAMVRPERLRLADLVAALSYALDLAAGESQGWAVRSCLIGMRLAEIIGLPGSERTDLYYALLLKDAGCSNNAARVAQLFRGDDIGAKYASKRVDWTRLSWAGAVAAYRLACQGRAWPVRLARTLDLAVHGKRNTREIVQLRCERGASIARKMGFSERTAEAIHALDEHWDGSGGPIGLRGGAIPRLARILGVAQVLALSPDSFEPGMRVLQERRGRWYEPDLVDAARELRHEGRLWPGTAAAGKDAARRQAVELDADTWVACDTQRLDDICEGLADVVDAKSAFTARHSRGVARAAAAVAARLGFTGGDLAVIRHAALLHDVGKLAVSNRILDKAGPLTPAEQDEVRRHPLETRNILSRIEGWGGLAWIAAAHHERLDGSGYDLGVTGAELSREARLIAVADVFDALAADRPYRAAMPLPQALGLMSADVPRALDADCVAALREAVALGELAPQAVK